MNKWIIIDTGYAYGAIEVRDGEDIVIGACPIFSWTIGRPLPVVMDWAKRKGYTVKHNSREPVKRGER